MMNIMPNDDFEIKSIYDKGTVEHLVGQFIKLYNAYTTRPNDTHNTDKSLQRNPNAQMLNSMEIINTALAHVLNPSMHLSRAEDKKLSDKVLKVGHHVNIISNDTMNFIAKGELKSITEDEIKIYDSKRRVLVFSAEQCHIQGYKSLNIFVKEDEIYNGQ